MLKSEFHTKIINYDSKSYPSFNDLSIISKIHEDTLKIELYKTFSKHFQTYYFVGFDSELLDSGWIGMFETLHFFLI
jgi:hypothetical protein